MQAQSSLRTLLFGAPLHGRGPGDVDALVAELNACLRGVLDLLAEEIGPCPSLEQATLEWQRLIDAPGGFEGVAVRRAALLFLGACAQTGFLQGCESACHFNSD